MSTTSEDKRKKRRYLLLLLLLLLAIVVVVFFLFRLGGDSTTSAPAAAPSASAAAAAPAASDAITSPGLPALEAYANGTSIGWQVTANPDDGGSPYAGYEVQVLAITKEIRADFPGDGSGAGMYSWTFGGQPTVMARTYNEAGLFSDWAAMLLPEIDPSAEATLTDEADASTKKKQPEPAASGANRTKPTSLIGETPERIVSLELLPPVMTGATPAERIRPVDTPTPSPTATEMPVTPVTPSADPSSSASPSSSPSGSSSASASASPSASPSRTHSDDDDSECKDGRNGNDKCQGKGSGDKHRDDHEDDHKNEHKDEGKNKRESD